LGIHPERKAIAMAKGIDALKAVYEAVAGDHSGGSGAKSALSQIRWFIWK
jgi:hypothetical protein